MAAINIFRDWKQWSCFILFNLDFINARNCKIWNFLKNPFSGPYVVNFLAKLNILWERKLWSCLIFFVPDFRIHLSITVNIFLNFLCFAHQLLTKTLLILNGWLHSQGKFLAQRTKIFKRLRTLVLDELRPLTVVKNAHRKPEITISVCASSKQLSN